MLAPSPPPSTSMDDEDKTWRLDASSISGFAIPLQPTASPQCETPVYIPIEKFEITVSQTLETHPFPYFLQIMLIPRHKKAGMVLLVPLNQITSVVISDHGILG